MASEKSFIITLLFIVTISSTSMSLTARHIFQTPMQPNLFDIHTLPKHTRPPSTTQPSLPNLTMPPKIHSFPTSLTVSSLITPLENPSIPTIIPNLFPLPLEPLLPETFPKPPYPLPPSTLVAP